MRAKAISIVGQKVKFGVSFALSASKTWERILFSYQIVTFFTCAIVFFSTFKEIMIPKQSTRPCFFKQSLLITSASGQRSGPTCRACALSYMENHLVMRAVSRFTVCG